MKSTVYLFREIKDINVNEGPIGAAQISLTPRRSMAIDRDFIPLGSLLWLETKDGLDNNLQQLVIAQDTGNAIKGAIRGDFFWGTGDEALKYAEE
jgi:membrane-bound lytic murein transglycosylase A